MTPSEIAKLLRARRIAPGKWMARCVAHRERTGSLSITDMSGGRTRLHCFGGCSQRDVLDAMGLDWSDLTAEKPLDREAYRAIEAERARQAQAESERKAVYARLCGLAMFWEYQAGESGKLLALTPESDMLDALFAKALRNVRILNAALSPMLHPAHGLTETIYAKRRKK